MSIQEELRDQLKDAMRQRDQQRANVIRQVKSEISVARSAPGFSGEVDDSLYRKVIGTYVKRMDKARKEYEELGERGQEMASQLAFEIEYLSRWLPTTFDEPRTQELVRAAIDELGISDPKQAGRVVGHLKKIHKDALDGALASRIARQVLEEQAK